jgi:hypothetical protein
MLCLQASQWRPSFWQQPPAALLVAMPACPVQTAIDELAPLDVVLFTA